MVSKRLTKDNSRYLHTGFTVHALALSEWLLDDVSICSPNYVFQAGFMKELPSYNQDNFTKYHVDSGCKSSVSSHE